ncbi:cleavage and polyadenylation specificity factor subunit 7 isoform X2 [Cynoglossus semilaevis]|uniref:cleavage and polyadenylation specificity factor subunit 7 isoform X2 n=1 Tax=Cynoglossus semilaevis TaxID=244447 RepID=UPI0004956421|nr:cleavage and polyadenylation specificity factor subunit 7 isoform X2 [Cynoglossus semilaevis]
MAAYGAAPGPSTSNWNMNQTQEDLDRIAEANELFDAVLTGSVDLDKKVKNQVSPAKKTSSSYETKSTDENEGSSNKRLALYIGNFPWWTSDADITSMAKTLGVKDIREIKFAENKVNGQSRGYAEVVVATTESFQTLLEKVPGCKVNGEKVECRFATHQNLKLFENVAKKRVPPRVSKNSDSSGTVASSSQEPSTLPKPPFFPMSTPPPLPFLSQQPPPFPFMPPNMSVPPPFIFPPSHQIPIQAPPSLHINPAFFNQDGQSSIMHNQQKQTTQVTDDDFEELMNRNRAVASSAISKAVSGAAAGDRDVSMETLLTAIAIIKQSRVYGDERCQALVTSLKDCLVSIQGNYSYSRSRDKDRDRDRDRGRDRERERTEDSSGWEGSRRREGRRERSWSREKSREHSRDRDRHRDYRDRYR